MTAVNRNHTRVNNYTTAGVKRHLYVKTGRENCDGFN